MQLESGRTHQIRVHMASHGHPVIGDVLYSRIRVLQTPQIVKFVKSLAQHLPVMPFMLISLNLFILQQMNT